MIIFDGKYDWDGKKRGDKFPVIWWPGSYRIKIIDLQALSPGVIHIKPYLCLFSGIDSEYNIKTRFERFAVQVADEFNLDPEKILWVESLSKEKVLEMDVAMLETVTKLRNETIYKTIWRQIHPNEIKLINNCGLIEQ